MNDRSAQDPHRPGTPPGMSEIDVSMRSEIGRFLGKEVWPADRARLLDVATENRANEDVIACLRALPEDEEFENLAVAWERIGGHNESKRT